MSSTARNRASAVYGVGLSFVVMAVSGALLFLAPKGQTAQRIDWHLLGLSREGWEALHLGTSVAFLIFGLWHTVLHWPILRGFVMGTSMHPEGHRREGVIVLGLILLLVVTAILYLPPTSWLIDLNEFFKKEYWEFSG